jgi:ABC-type branched-subunit amino acid transport system ATPase component/ABC-type branched-subunit amino acid transport system permease subunit
VQKFSAAAEALQKKYKLALYAIWALSAAACILAPLAVGKYYVGLITIIFLYSILSIGFNIAAGFCGVTQFATGAIYGVGAYVSAILTTTYAMAFIPAALAGTLAAGVFSLLISLSAYKVSGNYLALISFGLLEVVTRIITQWQEVTGGSSGFHTNSWVVFGLKVSRDGKYYIIFAVLIVFFVIQRNIAKSQWGRDFLAINNDTVAASGLGINVAKTRVIGFMICCLMSGFAGALYASYSGFISPESFGFNISIMVLLMVVAGGSGTLSGPVLGAIIVYVIPMFFNNYPDLKQIVYGALLVVLVQVLPEGVCGVIKNACKEIDYNTIIAKRAKSGDQSVIDFSRYAVDKSLGEDVLAVKGLTKQYGGLIAVNNLDFTIKRGTIHALIGPNGAGKTTAVNNITGIELPTSGEVYYNGKLITGKKSFQIANMGVSRTYQHVRLLKSMSVIDNIVMGTRFANGYGLLAAIFSTRKKRAADKDNYIEAQECLELIGLGDKSDEKPANLSSGQQKLLEICRALVVKPQLLVLDEPCAGLTEAETEQFSVLMQKIRETGISMLLIEHHMSLVMGVSDYITVIDHGTKISEGTPAYVSKDPIVLKAYLGQ